MRAEENNTTLEECLQRATPSLRKKIIHGVELLQKAEKIALKYSEDGFRIGFSGGKDSQATYHLTKIAGVKFKAWFNPTSVDPPEVIRFIRKEYPSVKFGKLERSIFQAALDQGCLPTARVRWCCAQFKENKGAGMVNVVGVRKAESARRAKRKEVEVSSHKFQGDLNEFEDWSKEKVDSVKKHLKNINQDQFTEVQSESTIRCVGGKDSIIIMPILEWSENDVWEFLNNAVQVPHCELYDQGRHRIGCIMCPMASLKDIVRDIKEYPHVYKNWLRVIRGIRNGDTTLYGSTPPPLRKVRINKGLWKIIETLIPPPILERQPTKMQRGCCTTVEGIRSESQWTEVKFYPYRQRAKFPANFYQALLERAI